MRKGGMENARKTGPMSEIVLSQPSPSQLYAYARKLPSTPLKHEYYYSKLRVIRIKGDLKNNSNFTEKMHWFRSICPENLFGLRHNSDYAAFTVVQNFATADMGLLTVSQ